MDDALLDLDAAALLAVATGAVRDRRLAEVRDLRVLAQWAALHAADPAQGPNGSRARRIGDVLVRLGGEGTPRVREFSLGEIAAARGTGVVAATNALADVLDLMHRLPLTWARCCAGQAEIWLARKVAQLSRGLGSDQVGLVDVAIARIIGAEAGGRVLAVAEAKVIEAAPEEHEERVESEKRRRYVGLSRTDEFGLRTVIARVQAGDAAWIEATVQRAADVLAVLNPSTRADELRSIAFGYLARPAELLTLLLEHTEAPAADEPEAPELNRALAFPADLLARLRTLDLTKLVPTCVLYVHLHEATLTGTAPGVGRVEGLGPMALSQLHGLLERTNVVVKPVIDLADRVRTTAYEHPEALKERVHLTTGGDYWPYATHTSRRVDYDHPTPYVDPDHGGPPDQTGVHNSGPLARRQHRWKTHAGYRSRQSGQGRYAWLTPHGLAFLVDHTGTHPIEPEDARMIIDAPSGVDVYPSAAVIELDLTG